MFNGLLDGNDANVKKREVSKEVGEGVLIRKWGHFC